MKIKIINGEAYFSSDTPIDRDGDIPYVAQKAADEIKQHVATASMTIDESGITIEKDTQLPLVLPFEASVKLNGLMTVLKKAR